jgi:outer membrane receptor for ferrienterochelin and colicins
MELQQKEQQIIFSGTLFYEDRWGGELQWEKNTVEVAKYMAKAFIPSAGNYRCELPCCRKKNVVLFSYTDHDQNLYMVIFLPS